MTTRVAETETCFCGSIELRAREAAGLRSNAYSGQRMDDSKNIQEPNDHADHHNRIQDGLDGARHRNEVIDQPEQNTNSDENHQDLKYRHCISPRGLSWTLRMLESVHLCTVLAFTSVVRPHARGLLVGQLRRIA